MPTIAIQPLTALNPARFDRPEILKGLAAASRQLAELKGVTASIPHAGILINALGMQEAKDSSAIENIVTTHDELFRDAAAPLGDGLRIQSVLGRESPRRRLRPLELGSNSRRCAGAAVEYASHRTSSA